MPLIKMRYELAADGSVVSGRVLFDMTDAWGEDAIDGLKVDQAGNLYVCGPGGVWTISSQSEQELKPMSKGLVPGAVLPDFELPDTTGAMRKLSELQGDNPMVLLLGRGEHCPRERQHQREMLKFYEWCAVAFTQLVTVLPNDKHDADRLRISTGAYWPYLCDTNLELQTALDIGEYTDPHHAANVPHAPCWHRVW